LNTRQASNVVSSVCRSRRQPRRGARRVGWLEWADEPVRRQLTRRHHEDLVSALATVIGWESFIVLLDVRGLTPTAAHRVTRDAAVALVDAAISRVG
jgi:hypothetical protein